MAWCCHKCGLDDEAIAHSKAAHAGCTEAEKDEYAGYTQKLEAAVAPWQSADGAARVDTLREQVAALKTAVSARRTYEFADGGERFLHQTLARLVADLRAFASERGEFTAVQARLAEAESVRQRSIEAHRPAWDAAIAAIAASPKYGGLRLSPQLGLVPLGVDPQSGLWEFVHLASGTPGKEFPVRDGTTKLLVPTGDMGIVFVLLPGGTFCMGAQQSHPNGPNYDDANLASDSAHNVKLEPFFLSKYELTQGQWARLWASDDGLSHPSEYTAKDAWGRLRLTNPVESVDRTMCDTLLDQHGLVLPTEAQWEYGCRAGTDTPWWTGRQATELTESENVPVGNAFDDGFMKHAPVGSRAGNGFGLFDVHGNVSEWCRDWFSSYGSERPGDGLRVDRVGSGLGCYRGGSYRAPAGDARSASRYINAPTIRHPDLGVRPARALQL